MFRDIHHIRKTLGNVVMITFKTFKFSLAIAILSSCSSGSSGSSESQNPKPEIVSFSANATKVKVNTVVAISWQSKNAENCLVKDEGNTVLAEGPNGSTNQTIANSTNFTLWCHSANQSVESKLLVSTTTDDGALIVNQDVSSEPSLWNLDHIDGKMDGFFKAIGSGKGVRVYVIDTGVFGGHPEFEGRVLEGSNVFGETMEGTGDVGYPKKGWLDEIYGKNLQSDDHGTHVAGIVAGKTFGIAKDATIIPVRMGDGNKIFDDEEKNRATRTNLLKALNFVWQSENNFQQGRAIVNVSMAVYRLMEYQGEWVDLSTYISDTKSPEGFKDELDGEFEKLARAIVGKGIPIFTAAGNTGCDYVSVTNKYILQNLAQSIPGLINVGNLGRDNTSGALYASNTSLMPEFWVPGSNILSASASFPNGKLNYRSRVYSGTSMASPLLAGYAAILFERNPNLEVSELEDVIRKSSNSRDALDHRGNMDGYCRPIENEDVFLPFLGRP